MENKTKELIRKLKIKVRKGKECSAEPHKNTIILSENATDYDILHEISHLICGWGCCREHCEWEAHGGAKVLCNLFGINKKQVEDAEERMKCYAHRTNPEACGRYSKKNSWVEEVKKEEREKMFKFKDFQTENLSGRFLINSFWLEHLLNLFYQGYIGEVWCELQDTLMNHKKLLENTAYGIIGENLDKKHLNPISEFASQQQGVKDE